MQLRWLVLAGAALLSWQSRASACSVVLPEKQSIECGPETGAAHTSAASAGLQLDAVEVTRSRYAPPGQGDCGELGSTRLRFSLAGSATWPEDVGVLVTLREGNFTYFQPPPTTLGSASGWLLLPQAGAVRFFGPDDPHQPLALVLDARAVDCSGAVSAPIEVRVNDPGRPPDADNAASGGATSTAGSGGTNDASGAAGAAPGDDHRLQSLPPWASCSIGAMQSGAPAPLGLLLTGLALALRSKTARARRSSPGRR